MKKMSCRDMGGDCDVVIEADTPEEMMEKGKKHVHDMAEKGDETHKGLVEKMKAMTPENLKEWESGFQKKWEETPLE